MQQNQLELASNAHINGMFLHTRATILNLPVAIGCFIPPSLCLASWGNYLFFFQWLLVSCEEAGSAMGIQTSASHHQAAPKKQIPKQINMNACLQPLAWLLN